MLRAGCKQKLTKKKVSAFFLLWYNEMNIVTGGAHGAITE